jgi:hypothetical protein
MFLLKLVSYLFDSKFEEGFVLIMHFLSGTYFSSFVFSLSFAPLDI